MGQIWISATLGSQDGHPVATRWLDISKGDSNRVELRSRFVAREIKANQDRARVVRGDVFSATPPHEPVHLLLSLAMTEWRGEEYPLHRHIMCSVSFASATHDLHRSNYRRSAGSKALAESSARACTLPATLQPISGPPARFDVQIRLTWCRWDRRLSLVLALGGRLGPDSVRRPLASRLVPKFNPNRLARESPTFGPTSMV